MALMTKKTYGQKLLDPRWQKKRLEVFERNNFTCQWCGRTDKTLHVHHFCYNKNGNPWDIDDSALVSLCEDCHKVEHLENLTPLERELILLFQTVGSIYSNTDESYLKSVVQEAISDVLKYRG